MDISIFLAKVLGLYLIIMAIAVFVNIRKLSSTINDDSLPFLFLSGAISLIVGLLIIVSHNIWEADWKVLITLIGWLAVIKAITRLVFPKHALKMIKRFLKNTRSCQISAVVMLILGAYLSYVGFMS